MRNSQKLTKSRWQLLQLRAAKIGEIKKIVKTTKKTARRRLRLLWSRLFFGLDFLNEFVATAIEKLISYKRLKINWRDVSEK
jgi:hypothetical protein